MRVVLTGPARADLRALSMHIGKDDSIRAKSFAAELADRARELALFPMRFPLVPKLEHLGLRKRVYGSYLIFYRIDRAQITVARILHGSRDYEAELFPDS